MPAHPHDTRLERLEIKASYADDLLDQLNTQVYQQQRQIDQLVREVARLRDLLDQQPQSAPFRSLLDERPPHY